MHYDFELLGALVLVAVAGLVLGFLFGVEWRDKHR